MNMGWDFEEWRLAVETYGLRNDIISFRYFEITFVGAQGDPQHGFRPQSSLVMTIGRSERHELNIKSAEFCAKR